MRRLLAAEIEIYGNPEVKWAFLAISSEDEYLHSTGRCTCLHGVCVCMCLYVSVWVCMVYVSAEDEYLHSTGLCMCLYVHECVGSACACMCLYVHSLRLKMTCLYVCTCLYGVCVCMWQ